MLRDAGTGRCGDDRRRGRDVDRARTVAACAGRVDEVVPLWPDGKDVGSHRLGAAGDLVGGLAVEPHGDQEAPDLRLRRFAAHDLIHHLARLRTREVAAFEQLGEGSANHGARKFSASSRPSGVRTLSGWN